MTHDPMSYESNVNAQNGQNAVQVTPGWPPPWWVWIVNPYVILLALMAIGYFGTIVGLNFYIYSELAFTPIVPTCCAGI